MSVIIAKYDIKRILVDNESSTNVLFYDAFQKMNMLDRLKQAGTLLVRFSGDPVAVEGQITLPVITEKEPHWSTVQLIFLVIKIPSAYNVIFGWPGLNIFKVMVSIYHLLVQFSMKDGVGEIWGDQMLARQYFLIATKMKKLVEALIVELPDQKDNPKVSKNWGEPDEQLIIIPLGEDPEKTIQIRS